MVPPNGACVIEATMAFTLPCLMFILASINQTPLRGSTFQPPQLRLVFLWGAVITDRAALPQNRVETLIGSQAEFEITNLIRIPFLSDSTTLQKIKLIFTHKF